MPKVKSKTTSTKVKSSTTPKKLVKRTKVKPDKNVVLSSSRGNYFLYTLFILFLASFSVFVYFFFIA